MDYTKPTPVRQDPPTPEGPRLSIKIGIEAPIRLRVDEVDDRFIGAMIRRAQEASHPVQLMICELCCWPDANRWHLLQFLRQLGDRCLIRYRGQKFSDAFQAVLAMMVGPANLQAHERSIRAAVEAAALFHPNVAEETARQINARLKDLGASNVRATTLAARIRNLLKPRFESGLADALDAARGFLQHLRHKLDLPGGELPIRYYQGTCFGYDGIRWKPLSDDYLIAAVTAFLQTGDLPKLGRTLVADVLANLRGLTLVTGDWSRSMPFYIDDEGQTDEKAGRFLVFQNGMIALAELLQGTDAQLTPHDSRWFSSVAFPFNYDSNALCVRWELFLNEVLRPIDENDRRQQILRAYVGYSILTDCRFEKMLILVGSGSNGKSVFLKTVARLLGDENVEHVPYAHLTQEFRLASLIGKSVNVTMEMNHVTKQDEALLRSIVSGEEITVNRKFRSPIKTKLFAKLLVATNDLPNFADATDATWRRLLIVPFLTKIPENAANRRLATELAAELPGIFNWALQGLRELISNNRFPSCSQSDAALSSHRTESDTVREFLDQCCAPGPGYEPLSQALYAVYRFWCRGRERKPVADNEFGRRMKRLGYEKGRGSTQPDGARPWVYTDLRLRPDTDLLVHAWIQSEHLGWSHFPYAATGACPGSSGQIHTNPDIATTGEAAS